MFRLTDDEQAKVTSRQLSVVAAAITSRNLMAVLLAGALGVTAYALHGWRVALLAARGKTCISSTPSSAEDW